MDRPQAGLLEDGIRLGVLLAQRVAADAVMSQNLVDCHSRLVFGIFPARDTTRGAWSHDTEFGRRAALLTQRQPRPTIACARGLAARVEETHATFTRQLSATAASSGLRAPDTNGRYDGA